MLSANVGDVTFSVSVWTDIVGDIVVNPCLLPGMLTAQRYRDRIETDQWGLLEDVRPTVRQRFWFQYDGRCLAVVGHDLPRKVNLTWKADCVASSLAGSNSNGFFPLGISEGARLRSSF
jgi:hypothetical protein